MKPTPDYYHILHVHPDAPTEIIKSSYRTLMQRMRMHPDLGGDTASAALINEAYETLMEPGRREAYDRMRRTRVAYETAYTAQNDDASVSACRFCHQEFPRRAADSEALFCPKCQSPRHMMAGLDVEESDRRNILRIPRQTQLEVYTTWPQARPLSGHTVDLSMTGFRLRCSAQLKPGQVIKLDARLFRAIAEVIRVTHAKGEVAVGGRFLTLHLERLRGAFFTGSV
jgi:curved DNA-binding protein CbpA